MSAFEQQQIDRLESQLADLSMDFYAAQDEEQRRAIASRYEVVFRQLERAPTWCGEPHLDSQLPDEWMPRTDTPSKGRQDVSDKEALERHIALIQERLLDERKHFEEFKSEQLEARNQMIRKLGLEAHYDLTAESLVEIEPSEASEGSGAGQAHP